MLTNRAHLFPLFVLAIACAAGCSSSTSTVSEATVGGVCGKLSELACAKDNCTQVLELAQKRCPAKTFQSFLDCASITKAHCESRNGTDVAILESCEADLERVNACAEAEPTASSSPSGVGAECTDARTCPTWPCSCSDGTIVKVASCSSSQKCADPIATCGKSSPALVAACEGNGGP